MKLNVDFERVDPTIMTATEFDVTFTDMNSKFDMSFSGDSTFNADFGEVHEVGKFDVYEGEYNFTPIAEENIVVPTAKKYLEDDIVVKPIPYAAVSNLADGLTVTIG